jgi:hypothetical protein
MMRLAFTVLKCQYATKDMSFCYRLRHKLSTASSLACTRRSINGSAMSSLLLPLQKAHDGKATIFTLLTPLYSYSDGAGLPVLLCYLVTASRCPVSSKLILRPRMPPRFCLLPLKSLTLEFDTEHDMSLLHYLNIDNMCLPSQKTHHVLLMFVLFCSLLLKANLAQ